MFSVVTVCLNDLAGLVATTRSIRSQDFQDFEHIVVDGGSADETTEFLVRYAQDSERVVFETGPDGGIYAAMTRGAVIAKGRNLVFLNSGDRYANSEALGNLAEALEGDVMWAYSKFAVIDSGVVRRRSRGLGRYSLWLHAYGGHSVCHQSVAMNRHFFWELGGFDERWGLAADSALLLRAGRLSPPAHVESVDVLFEHGGRSADAAIERVRVKHQIRVEELGLGAAGRRLDAAYSSLASSWMAAKIWLRPKVEGSCVGAKVIRVWAGELTTGVGPSSVLTDHWQGIRDPGPDEFPSERTEPYG